MHYYIRNQRVYIVNMIQLCRCYPGGEGNSILHAMSSRFGQLILFLYVYDSDIHMLVYKIRVQHIPRNANVGWFCNHISVSMTSTATRDIAGVIYTGALQFTSPSN